MIAAARRAAQLGQARRIALLFACVAPLGWLLFWAVFHTVPGQDWVVFHTAAALFRAGDTATLADPHAFTDVLNRTHRAWFAQPVALHPWVYPPVTLLVALAFGSMSYPLSLAAFLVVTLLALLAALRPWQPDRRGRTLLCVGAVACPATAFTLGAGQLSFLVAACVLAGMAWLDARPFLAGFAFSLLCLKPQFVPLVPVALLAGRHWRAIAGGLAGGTALVLASLVVAGAPVWTRWLVFASGADPLLGAMIQAMRTYDQSVHTSLRMLGATEGQAGIGQMLATALAALAVWRTFSVPCSARRRLVVLLCALVWGAPHVGDYDEIMPAIAAMLVLLDAATRPWRRGEAWLAAGAWLATAFNPPALIAALGLPVLTLAAALTPLLVGGLMAAGVPWSRTPPAPAKG